MKLTTLFSRGSSAETLHSTDVSLARPGSTTNYEGANLHPMIMKGLTGQMIRVEVDTGALLKTINSKPAYSATRAFVEDEIAGPMGDWDPYEIWGAPQDSGCGNEGFLELAEPRLASLSSSDLIDEIKMLAPLGALSRARNLYSKVKELEGSQYTSASCEAHRFVLAAMSVAYLKSLVGLSLIGPRAAMKICPADRDNYPTWYGNYNWVAGEVIEAVQEHIPVPQRHSVVAAIDSTLVKNGAEVCDFRIGDVQLGFNYKKYSKSNMKSFKETVREDLPWLRPKG